MGKRAKRYEFCRERMREARIRAGLSTTDLADVLGKTKRSIEHWESGRFVPKVDDLTEIAYAVGKTPFYFIERA